MPFTNLIFCTFLCHLFTNLIYVAGQKELVINELVKEQMTEEKECVKVLILA